MRIIQEESEEHPVKFVVLDAYAVSQVDATSIEALRTMIEAQKEKGIEFMIANARGQTRFLLDEYLHQKKLLTQRDLIVGIGELVLQAEKMLRDRREGSRLGLF